MDRRTLLAFIIDATSQPQLDTPTNLTASGTTITFDEVENATSYEVFADGVSIGEYAPVSGYNVTIICDDNDREVYGQIIYYADGTNETVTYSTGSSTNNYSSVIKIKFGYNNSGGVWFYTGTGSFASLSGQVDKIEVEITQDSSANIYSSD